MIGRFFTLLPSFIAAWLASVMLATSAHAACDKNVSCENLSDCKPHETFRIPFSTIRQCIEKGIDPPIEWKRQGGKGAVNTGGAGDLSVGGLNDPFMPDSGTMALNPPGGPKGADLPPGGGFGGGFPSGPATSSPPNCGSYKHPRLTSGSDLLGERQKVGEDDKYDCGYAIELDHDWALLTPSASYAIITIAGKNEMQVYRKSGSRLDFSHKVALPSFYCELREETVVKDGQETTITYTEKIPIEVGQHYAEVSNKTQFIPLTYEQSPGATGIADVRGSYVLMEHEGGGRFKPPASNANALRVNQDTDVDNTCYSADQLFSETIPDGFGSIMFGQRPVVGGADAETITPHAFLENPERCEPFVQYYDSNTSSFYVPPTGKASSGDIRGGTPYSRKSVRSEDGKFVSHSVSGLFYDGAMIYLGNVQVFLGTKAASPNIQSFPDGASFTINENRQLKLEPPGRIRLYSDYRMQLLDGGTVEDTSGNIINIVRPNAYIQFEQGKVVVGASRSNLVAPVGSVLPTNKDEEMLLPYDSRLNQVCE